MKRMRALLPILALATVALSLDASPAAAFSPATFVVNSTSDAPDANPGGGLCATPIGECTLRAAIEEANALPGPQTVRLPEDEFELSTITIADTLTMIGAGIDASRVAALERETEATMIVEPNAIVSISNVTIDGSGSSGSVFADCGGAIRNLGTLTLSDITIRNYHTFASGGGICNSGSLTIRDSLLESNRSDRAGGGGAIVNGGQATLERVTVRLSHSDVVGAGAIDNGGMLTVRDSQISENYTFHSGEAGGVGNSGPNAHTVIINSTISGNVSQSLRDGNVVSPDIAGGLSNANGGSLTLINSTVTANSATGGPGGGVATQTGSTTTLINTIVARNEGADCASVIYFSPPVSGGHNLDGDGTCGLSGPGDISGADPLLGPLADNGGPTLTHALLAGSPAIGAGDPAQCPEADQRGAPRDAACDIGAFEAGAVVPTPGPAPRGDLDCDGAVTLVDAFFALGSAAAVVSLPQCEGETGDADCDGDIDGVDGLLIVKQVADLPVEACAVS